MLHSHLSKRVPRPKPGRWGLLVDGLVILNERFDENECAGRSKPRPGSNRAVPGQFLPARKKLSGEAPLFVHAAECGCRCQCSLQCPVLALFVGVRVGG
jgi:hypothetical protein